VTFVGSFNVSAPAGLYNTWAQAMDNESNFIHPGWFQFGHADRIPLPPIALECSLEDWWYGEEPAWYDLRILNESLQPIRYAEAGDTIIFELRMNRPIDYAAFSLGYVSMREEHRMNITYAYPDIYYEQNTTWTTWEIEEQPQLGFTYNATTGEVQALLFYENWTWTWREWGGGGGGWEMQREMVPAEGLMLDTFFDFNETASGPVDEFTVRWQGSLTDQVMRDYDSGYGTVFHVWPWNPGDYGTRPVDGDRSGPSEDFAQNDGVQLAYHDIIVDGFITDPSGEIVDHLDHSELFNLSMDIHAPSEMIECSEPYTDEYGDLHLINLTTDYMVVWFYGNAWGWNETHYWFLHSEIEITLDIENLTVVNQFCTVTNETWDLQYAEPVSHEEWNITTDLMEISNIYFIVGDDLTRFGFQAKFLDQVPDGEYHLWVKGIQTYEEYRYSETDGWMLDYMAQFELYIGDKTFWSPAFLTLGSVLSWAPEKWAVTDDGALDLDGDLSTVDDQYFVKHVFYWHDEGSWTENSLRVGIYFDPSPGEDGDEFMSRNWMGIVTVGITFTWSEAFYWFHADDRSPVSAAEMDELRELVWADMEEDVPAPGYYAIAWMTVNRSWEDIVEDEWWWLEDNTWEFSWFGFGTEQEFQVASSANSTTWARFRSEFAGLLLFVDNTTLGGNGVPDFTVSEGFVDSDETSHFFVIEHVGDIEFMLPFDSTEPSGERVIGVDETVDFGVRIFDVNGTLFPIHTRVGAGIRGCWDYMGSAEALMGLNATDFDYMVESATIDEMAFEVHYAVHMAGTPENPDPYNHLIDIKVDQYIGNWYLHHFDNTVLEGRGLAIAYFAQLTTETYTEFQVGDTPVHNNNDDTQIGDVYQFGVEGRTFASVHMGGQTYVWGKDGQTYNCSAATVPLGAFSAMFESTAGTTVSRWTMESNFYFMISGFTHWDGYSIDNDPTFGVYTTALKTIEGGVHLPTAPLVFFLIVAAIVVIVVVVTVVNIRRKEREPQQTEPVSDYWSQIQRWG